jgi:hypothetical protein
MKFEHLKSCLVEIADDEPQTIYYVDDPYIIEVLKDDGTYTEIEGEIILFHGGIDPNHPLPEIRFFPSFEGEDYSAFTGPISNDIEVDVRVYKQIDSD